MKLLAVASLMVLQLTSSALSREHLSKEKIATLPQEQVQILMRHCAAQWPEDFHMRVHCEDYQFEALEQLIERGERP